MQSMNKERLKKNVINAIVNDKYDLPIYICKAMKNDLKVTIKRYLKIDENNFKICIKPLKSGEYLVELKTVASGFLIK